MAEAEARLARAQSDKIVAEANLQTAFEAYQSLTGLEVMSLKGFDGPIGLPATMAAAEAQALSHPCHDCRRRAKALVCSLKY